MSISVVALAAAGVVLTGCSSDDGGSGKSVPDDGTGKATVSVPDGDGKGSAKLTYSGGDSGEVTIKSVRCAVMNGKLAAITAPDSAGSSTPAKPSFTAVVNGDKAMTTLTTKDGASYLHASAPGLSGSRSGDTWVVTVAGLKLGPTDPSGESITVDGTITCGTVAGG
ncbi:hypothetical protein G3I33_05170 [Streptomyces sp. SID9124]|nr:hypothetical protein [Streptomyces sp. SID9124]NED10885.1 hypothetical protein [Streptomyces sp. SID9124]